MRFGEGRELVGDPGECVGQAGDDGEERVADGLHEDRGVGLGPVERGAGRGIDLAEGVFGGSGGGLHLAEDGGERLGLVAGEGEELVEGDAGGRGERGDLAHAGGELADGGVEGLGRVHRPPCRCPER